MATKLVAVVIAALLGIATAGAIRIELDKTLPNHMAHYT